ncbi:hypothetical protein PR048_023803 [Dryococelus australis]|uniref:Uncharacterized protein n=1 Tax=Dryococelus australis TaxID=614101 RepID=A0ABQ9GV19_9NEOP|nr:hypothetical protein PR048_023803 [Dryococelus australis]
MSCVGWLRATPKERKVVATRTVGEGRREGVGMWLLSSRLYDNRVAAVIALRRRALDRQLLRLELRAPENAVGRGNTRPPSRHEWRQRCRVSTSGGLLTDAGLVFHPGTSHSQAIVWTRADEKDARRRDASSENHAVKTPYEYEAWFSSCNRASYTQWLHVTSRVAEGNTRIAASLAVARPPTCWLLRREVEREGEVGTWIGASFTSTPQCCAEEIIKGGLLPRSWQNPYDFPVRSPKHPAVSRITLELRCARNDGENVRSPIKNPPTSRIARHNPHMRKFGSDPAGDCIRFAMVGSEQANRSAIVALQCERASANMPIFNKFLGEPGSISSAVAPEFTHVLIRTRRCRWSAGFLVGPPTFLPPLNSRASPHSPRFTLINSQDLDAQSNPIIFAPLHRSRRLVTARSREPMRVIEVSIEWRRNGKTEEMGDARENPTTSGIVRHDSYMR